MRGIWIELGLAMLIGAWAPSVHADDTPVDTVVLLDVTSEMGRAQAFASARELLLDLVPHIARPGAQVAIIPFGEGAHTPIVVRVPLDDEGAAAAAARLNRVLDSARARDRHRFLYAAMERGLEEMHTFARRHPRRERRLVIISFGERSAPVGESAQSLADRIAKHDRRSMSVGRDWSLWYGYYGGGDPVLRRFIRERGAGSSLDLDGGVRNSWRSVHVRWPRIELGRKKTGAWTQTVTVVARGRAGTTLNMRAGVGPDARGASLTVTPLQVRLRSREQTFQLQLSGYARAGSNYHGAWLRADVVATRPVWVSGARVALLTGGSRAQVRFPSPVVDFTRIDRGTKITRTFDLVANDEAKQRRCELGFEAVDLPPDVVLTVEPAVARLDKVGRVKILLAAYAGAKPGRYASRILLKPREGLHANRREVIVRYEVGRGGIRILQSSLVVPSLVRGGDVIVKLTLVPDDGAVEAGARVRVKVGDLPAGLEVEVPRKFALHEETDLEIRLRSPPGTPNGILRAELHFSAFGEIRVVPSVIPVEVRIVPPPPIPLGGRVELGEIYRSTASSVSASIPIDIDRVHRGTLLEFVPASDRFRITPNRQRLKAGKQSLHLTIQPESVDLGATGTTIRVYSLRAGVRRLEGEYALTWTVLDSYLRVVEWRAPPPLTVGANLTTAKLTIESTPDLKGRDVDLVVNFTDLPADVQFAAVLDSVRLQGRRQSVTVPIDVVRSVPGRFPGTLRLEFHEPRVDTSQLRPLPLAIEVPSPPLANELLDPEKQRKMMALGGALVLVFFALAFVFGLVRRRMRRTVEFGLPEYRPELSDSQEHEVRTAFTDEKF